MFRLIVLPVAVIAAFLFMRAELNSIASSFNSVPYIVSGGLYQAR